MLRVRQGSDGSYWIPRKDKETEDWLDSQFIRVDQQLKWRNRLPDMSGFFHNCHKDGKVAIIGKGPTLDLLTPETLQGYDCIFALNEAVLKIESLDMETPLYGTQLDHSLGETCRPSKMSTKLFCGPRCANLYDRDVTKIVIDPAQFGLPESCLSAVYAISLARHMGCTRADLYGFDGCLKSNYNYARCVGYPSTKGGSPLRFAAHRRVIEEAAKNISLDWIQIKGEGKSVTSKLI